MLCQLSVFALSNARSALQLEIGSNASVSLSTAFACVSVCTVYPCRLQEILKRLRQSAPPLSPVTVTLHFNGRFWKENLFEELIEKQLLFHIDFSTKVMQKLPHILSIVGPQVSRQVGHCVHLFGPMDQWIHVFPTSNLAPSLCTRNVKFKCDFKFYYQTSEFTVAIARVKSCQSRLSLRTRLRTSM